LHAADDSLILLQPVPEERLLSWLAELYGKPASIARRELLRHRDLSMVERICLEDALPESVIYKQVLPPWDIEQDLHERVLRPNYCHSPQLYMVAHYEKLTALFLEDMGSCSLLNCPLDADLAGQAGWTVARMHRAYASRIEDLIELNLLPVLQPPAYPGLTEELVSRLQGWSLLSADESASLQRLSQLLSSRLKDEPISLVHGDLYAENLLLHDGKLAIIDWSWFTTVGAAVMDLACLVSQHIKNGNLFQWRDEILRAYCQEAGREVTEVAALIPFAETVSRLLFLKWLVQRRLLGIMGTTVGPVDQLIPKVVTELIARHQSLPH
jgi:hypothetical protein